MTEYYVYAYVRKSDGTPYYLGKGKGKRAYNRTHNVSVPNNKSQIVFLEKNLTNIGAIALERRYIRWYGRKDLGTGILYNRTDGGDGWSGTIPWNKGVAMLEEMKKHLSKVRTGKKQTPERIAHRALKNIGRTTPQIFFDKMHKALANGIHSSQRQYICPYCNRLGKQPSIFSHIKKCKRYSEWMHH